MDTSDYCIHDECEYYDLRYALKCYKGNDVAFSEDRIKFCDKIIDSIRNLNNGEDLLSMEIVSILIILRGNLNKPAEIFVLPSMSTEVTREEFRRIIEFDNHKPHVSDSYVEHIKKKNKFNDEIRYNYSNNNLEQIIIKDINNICMELYNLTFDLKLRFYNTYERKFSWIYDRHVTVSISKYEIMFR